MTDLLSAIHIYFRRRVLCTTMHIINPLIMCIVVYETRIQKKYGLPIRDSIHLKNQSNNDNDNNNGDNNSNNTNLARKLQECSLKL